MAEQDFDQSPLAPEPGHKSLLFLLRKKNKQRKRKEEASRRKRGVKERTGVKEKPARTRKTAAFGPVCHPGHCSGAGRARAHIHFFYLSADID